MCGGDGALRGAATPLPPATTPSAVRSDRGRSGGTASTPVPSWWVRLLLTAGLFVALLLTAAVTAAMARADTSAAPSSAEVGELSTSTAAVTGDRPHRHHHAQDTG